MLAKSGAVNSPVVKHPKRFNLFVELGGGVDDMPRWCRDGVCVELGFR